MSNYPTVSCGSAEHTWMRIVGATETAIVVGYVVSLAIVLRRNQRLAYPDDNEAGDNIQSDEDRRNAEKFQAQVSRRALQLYVYSSDMECALLRSGVSSTMRTLKVRTTGTLR